MAVRLLPRLRRKIAQARCAFRLEIAEIFRYAKRLEY
jgi:hypothetical protein